MTLPRLADAAVQDVILEQRHGKKVRQYWDAAKNDAREYLHPLDPKPGTADEDYRAISVTSALGSLDKPGVLQWSLDQQAAVAVTQAERLLQQSEEKGFSWLRYAGGGVLRELSERGDHVHAYMEARLNPNAWPVEPDTVEEAQMMVAGDQFLAEHWVEDAQTELTVWSHAKEGQKYPYAGTLDGLGLLDGVFTLWDIKSARRFQATHVAQMAGLAYADEFLQEAEPFKWKRFAMPRVEQVAVLQLRPDYVEFDGSFVPAHYKLTTIPFDELGPYYELFLSALSAKHAMRSLKKHFDTVRDASEKEEE